VIAGKAAASNLFIRVSDNLLFSNNNSESSGK
jgi:hypothetical protein